MLFSRRAVSNALLNKVAAKNKETKTDAEGQAQVPAPAAETGRSVDVLMERLSLLKR